MSVGKNIIIVEDESDKFTFEAIMNENFLEMADNSLIKWEIRSAESNIERPNGLKDGIKSIFKDITKGACAKIGIIWDTDSLQISDRVQQVKNAIQLAINEYSKEVTFVEFSTTSEFGTLTLDDIEVPIACFFVNVEGRGEIEDLLKLLKAADSPIADCVNDCLPKCVREIHETDIRSKELVKLWINNYIRIDTLKPNQRNARYTKWENIMKNRRDIFDFRKNDIPEYESLKEFLKLFTN